MRLIDADALIADHSVVCSRSMKFNLDLAPTIDAVPVVRCGECKNWESLKYTPRHFCPKVHEWTEADFFCKWGQRREEGDA